MDIHDSRVGIFFAVDPLSSSYPWNSVYAFSENVVVNAVELEGLEKVHVYNIWYDKNGKEHKKFSHTYTDNNLKENLNRVNTYDAHGNIATSTFKNDNKKVTYNGDKVDNQHLYNCFKSTSFAKKTPEQQEIARKQTSENAPDATYYGSLEGSYDSGNSGGRLSGKTGWDNGGKQLTFAVVGVVFAPFSIAEGGFAGGVATLGLLNSVDDGIGTITNDKGNALSIQLTEGTIFENYTFHAKGLITTLNALVGLGGVTKSIYKGKANEDTFAQSIGTANDVKGTAEYISKIIQGNK